ncbi:MAG: hypothetical protein WBB73_01090 [Candidatus Aminicenantaceae bacterium]
MKNNTVGAIGLLLSLLALTSAITPLYPGSSIPPQQTRRTQDEYLSTLLSRNTDPVGLKEHPELQRLLRQPAVKWAVRSTRRHILN